jgi:cyclomaltodextrinase / maltogenic alpha-amylase / neopullulanase
MKTLPGQLALLILVSLVFITTVSAQVSWWEPENPEPGDLIAIYYDTDPGIIPSGNIKLHWGINQWSEPPQAMWPPNTVVADPGQSVQTPLIFFEGSVWYIEIQTDETVEQLDYVFTNGVLWENNGGSDWHIYMGEQPAMSWHRFTLDSRSIDIPYTPEELGTVYLKGDFNGWGDGMPLNGPDERGVFWYDVQLMEVGYGYKFHADGDNWMQDPDNPNTDGGMFNNSLVMAEPKDMPYGYGFRPYVSEIFQSGETVPLEAQFYPTDVAGASLTEVDVNLWPTGVIPDYTFSTDTGVLTGEINGLSPGVYELSVTVSDDQGGDTNFRWGFVVAGVDDGYNAYDNNSSMSDAIGPGEYTAPTTNEAVDLLKLELTEAGGGEQIAFSLTQTQIDPESRVLMQISTTVSGAPEANPDFATEISVRDFNGIGVQFVLADPLSDSFDANVHNRLITNRNPIEYGPSIDVSIAPAGDYEWWQFEINVADLEAVMGSYGFEWYYAAYSFFEGFEPTVGHSWEIGLDNGGHAEDYDPDAFDMLFTDSYRLQTILFSNNTSGRNVTIDAVGRGLAAIAPSEIGPNIGSSGPVIRWLTRDWSTIQDSKSLYAELLEGTFDVTVTHTFQDGETTTILEDRTGLFDFGMPLEPGENLFQMSADDGGDIGYSSILSIFYETPQAPVAELNVSIDDDDIVLSASQSSDPQDQPLAFEWTADPDNPAPVVLTGANSSVATFGTPETLGEYYFDITLEDTDENITHARTMVDINADGPEPFAINQSVDWVQDAVVYEIFVRAYNASEQLTSITADMGRIANLGVTCIWFMPIHPGPSTHGYAITDYFGIEPDYGTLADFEELVTTAHEYGLKIVLDQVINHCAIEHPWMQDAIANGEASNTYDWFDRDGNGDYTYYYDWTSLPNLNYDNPDLRHYMLNMAKWWIEEYDIDGYRCDVAWGVQERYGAFWPQWRAALKTIKPEVFLLAEANAGDFTYLTNRFDSAYDWDLHHGGGNSFNSLFTSSTPGGLQDRIMNFGFDWPDFTFPFRFMENHDEDRFINGHAESQTKTAATLMLSTPGIPLIYAGQEVGEESQRGVIAWDDDPYNMLGHYGTLLELRTRLKVMRSVDQVLLDNDQGNSVYSYGRYLEGEEIAVVLINLSGPERATTITIPTEEWGIEAGEEYYLTDAFANNSQPVTGAELATISYTLSGYGSNVFVISDEPFVLGVNDTPTEAMPDRFSLGQNYPNPFNPTTEIRFSLGKSSVVKLAVYNVLGQRVTTLVNEQMAAGSHTVTFGGKDQFGRELASGVYFYRIEAGDFTQSRKMVMLK